MTCRLDELCRSPPPSHGIFSFLTIGDGAVLSAVSLALQSAVRDGFRGETVSPVSGGDVDRWSSTFPNAVDLYIDDEWTKVELENVTNSHRMRAMRVMKIHALSPFKILGQSLTSLTFSNCPRPFFEPLISCCSRLVHLHVHDVKGKMVVPPTLQTLEYSPNTYNDETIDFQHAQSMTSLTIRRYKMLVDHDFSYMPRLQYVSIEVWQWKLTDAAFQSLNELQTLKWPDHTPTSLGLSIFASLPSLHTLECSSLTPDPSITSSSSSFPRLTKLRLRCQKTEVPCIVDMTKLEELGVMRSNSSLMIPNIETFHHLKSLSLEWNYYSVLSATNSFDDIDRLPVQLTLLTLSHVHMKASVLAPLVFLKSLTLSFAHPVERLLRMRVLRNMKDLKFLSISRCDLVVEKGGESEAVQIMSRLSKLTLGPDVTLEPCMTVVRQVQVALGSSPSSFSFTVT